MNYPLISEYIEAIKAAEENFEELKYLRPILDEDGEPVMSSGNFAVVFKMKDLQTGKLHAVKCFLKEQEGRAEAYRMIAEELEYVSSTFLTPIKYMDKELFVDTNTSDETEFPVLLMDWVEGITLDKYIRQHIDNQYELSLLAYQFSRLAMWLMPQPFAHGDLKPDNILVKDDGTLVLVDYDGMYVPAMKSQKARELGSPDFRHPNRTEADFDEHIDDFSLVSILLSLKAIALQPSLLKEYGASDRLLFSAKDYRNLSESSALGALQPLMQDAELASLYSLYILALSQNNLSQVSFRLFNLKRPDKLQYEEENLSAEVSEDDLANAWTDEFGVKYSKDKKRLLKGDDINSYEIKAGTKVICRAAFCNCESLKKIIIPDGLVSIGRSAFSHCSSLSHVNIPRSVTSIESATVEIIDGTMVRAEHSPKGVIYSKNYRSMLEECSVVGTVDFKVNQGKHSFFLGSKVYYIGTTLHGKSADEIAKLGSQIKICDCSVDRNKWVSCLFTSMTDIFKGCDNLTQICIPYGTKDYFDLLFPDDKDKIKEQIIEDEYSTEVTEEDLANAWIDEFGVKYSSDRKRLLKAPYNLHEYDIRKGTIAICYGAFEKCTMLANITIPNSVIIIGEAAFFRCESIDNISIPNSVVIIKGFAFSGCFNLTNLNIPDTVTSIGELAFNGCTSLDNMYIPHSVLSIGDGVFRGCVGLSKIIVDKNNTTYDSRESCNAIIERASNRLIAGCKNTIIPDTVSIIGARAFEKCKTLTRIHIPDSVISIESSAFDSCYSLTDINIPDSVTSIGDYAFQFCSRLANIIIPNSVTSIGDSVFFACESFTDITIPNNVKSIGELAFYGCNRLKKLSLLNGVKKIGKSAFEQCRSLTHLSFPDSIISIEQEAFSLCQNLIDIFFSNAKVEIEQEVFSGCENIEKVYIPVGTRTIFEGILPELKDKFIEKNKAGSNSSDISKDKVSDSWWADENGLPYIIDYLPNSSDKTKERNDNEINSNGEIYNERVTDEDLVNAWTDQFGAKYSLDRKRLLKGPNISSYTIIDGTLVICESAFSLHDKLIEINIPSSVIQIGEKAFWCCKKLKSVRIPQSVKVIKKETFQYCFSLTNVDIPESVKKIESGAFEDCPNIINLSFPKDADVDSTVYF